MPNKYTIIENGRVIEDQSKDVMKFYLDHVFLIMGEFIAGENDYHYTIDLDNYSIKIEVIGC